MRGGEGSHLICFLSINTASQLGVITGLLLWFPELGVDIKPGGGSNIENYLTRSGNLHPQP